MTAQPQEARLVIDGKVSHLQSEVSEEVCRLQDQANTEISRLQAEVNEKILCIRTEVGAKVSSLKATFGQEKSRLNCQRNTLSPVYRLPPELLSSIFFTSLTTSQKSKYVSYINPDARIHNMISQPNRDRLSGFEPWASVPDSLRLCHVCQYWRSVALGSPSLWKHIQVGQRMSSQLLQFMRANARHAPLTIDVDCPNYISLFKIRPLDVLSDVIDTGLKQLRSLAICCNKPAFAHIEPCLSTALTADQLESLQLVVHGPTGQEMNIFPTGTPNLKRLDLRGVVIPWSSTVLRSPHLTHLALHHIPDLDASAMAELLSFLRHATKLVSVHLDLPQQATLTWEDVGGQLRTPVKLPNIETCGK